MASINLSASTGRAGLKVGDRVRINGTGLYTGELATIEKLATGAIPSAVVRTEAGRTRQVRTIDLEPVSAQPPTVSAASTATTPSAAANAAPPATVTAAARAAQPAPAVSASPDAAPADAAPVAAAEPGEA